MSLTDFLRALPTQLVGKLRRALIWRAGAGGDTKARRLLEALNAAVGDAQRGELGEFRTHLARRMGARPPAREAQPR